MLSKSLIFLLSLIILVSCQKESVTPTQGNSAELSKNIDELIFSHIESAKMLFNWNEQSDDFICKALPLTGNTMVVGFDVNLIERESIESFINQNDDIEISESNDKLGILYLKTENCSHLSSIRNLPGVEYIELDYFPNAISRFDDGSLKMATNIFPEIKRTGDNPGDFVPGSEPYLNYLQGIDGGSTGRAYNENMDKVYHELGHYGSSATGIAVIDNGVHADQVPYLSIGSGGYDVDGYYMRDPWMIGAEPDGPHPLATDFFGIWQLITPSYNHGTTMSDNVYSLAPFAHRITIRASPTYILITPGQLKSVTNAIKDLADDEDIKIISMSMAGPFKYNQMTSAIRYFNSKNKIMICAAGSSFPILKDLLGVLYPARLPETISITGIENLDETNGVMTLGFYAHCGTRNDFVVESSNSSSTATSSFAGMMAVIWNINPDLDREILIQLMIDNSSFNIQQGSKHSKFGWGKVDMYQLALDVEATL